MEPEKLIETLAVAERLKDATRHCYTSRGRRESVAEHSWRITLMAYFVSDESPDADLLKIMKMCLTHDLGEAFTGDIPAFEKTDKDSEKEADVLGEWVKPFRSHLIKRWQNYIRKWKHSRLWNPGLTKLCTSWKLLSSTMNPILKHGSRWNMICR